MRDMNFFAPFLIQKHKPKAGSLFRVLIVLIMMIMIIAPATIYILMSRINNQIGDIRGELNLPKNLATMETLAIKREQLSKSNASVGALSSSNAYVKAEQWFNEVLLKSLVDTLPKQVAVLNLSISSLSVTVPGVDGAEPTEKNLNGFTISGLATDRPAVAEFVYNLRLSGIFREIFVSNITEVLDEYQFSAQFFVKDGDTQ